MFTNSVRVAGVVALGCMSLELTSGAAKAQPNVFFTSGQVTGTLNAIGFRESDWEQIDDIENNAEFSLRAEGGSGGTSGGLIDADFLVAWGFVEFTAGVMIEGPGTTNVSVMADGQATFHDPVNYTGNVDSSVLVTVVRFMIDIPQGTEVLFTMQSTGDFAGITTIRRGLNGPIFSSGSMVGPGEYDLITSFNLSIHISEQNHTDTSGGTIRATFARLPLCAADFNADGVLNSQDLFDYLACFFDLECGQGDFNADQAVNSQDFFDFLTAFFSDC